MNDSSVLDSTVLFCTRVRYFPKNGRVSDSDGGHEFGTGPACDDEFISDAEQSNNK